MIETSRPLPYDDPVITDAYQRVRHDSAHLTRSEIQAAVGNLYGYAGMTDEAWSSYQTALEDDPCNLEALRGMARTMHEAGRHIQARDYCERARDLDPGHSRTNVLYASIREALGEPRYGCSMRDRGNRSREPVPDEARIDREPRSDAPCEVSWLAVMGWISLLVFAATVCLLLLRR
jgi:tetratricopeptide (TPR) repeat protein